MLAVIMSRSMTAEELAEEIAQFLVDPRAIIFEDAKKTSEFLDRIENRYFERMREAIEEREKSDTAS